MAANTHLPALADPAYRIESELGSGGGGVVYKAWHTRLQKHVVIKELKKGYARNIETQRNEVEALKNVKSAYLPQVYDFIKDGSRVYTVIEFVGGESLDKLLKRGEKFSQQQVVKWYGQLTSALESIHKQNICHRDIKPANIMLTPSGDVCLIDFNAALVSGSDARLISRSLGYASPEQYGVYERYVNVSGEPVRSGGSSGLSGSGGLSDSNGSNVNLKTLEGTETELLTGGDSADDFYGDSQLTELLSGDDDSEKTELIAPSLTAGIDWKRSDIYSLGATMYHLLSGKRPPQRAADTIPLSKLGHFSEGLVYVIEQSMRLDPAERFPSVHALSDSVRNIHRHDTRWRISQSKRIAAAIILPLAFALFATAALLGGGVMAQEKEERYYAAVYDIENGSDPQGAFNSAVDMFWDRIGPYRAMAMRLWNDGGADACREFIEQNLGKIAQFQNAADASRSLGDVYYILGNTYYYQAGEPDYHMAKENFEIAVRFVTDNPAYLRDYAISLARTGNITEAEGTLEKARSLNLESDSLDLLNGEISFARREYDSAIGNFERVISLSSDDYLRYRAYHTSDEIFRLKGQPERSVVLLKGALNRIPLNRVPEMTERLADAYVKIGDYDNAIALFEQLSASGAPQFHIQHGLAILLQYAGEFDRAVVVLDRMSDWFPNDFRVPMRQAFLEADRQSGMANEDRDYALTLQYYNNAARLYSENVRPGESDPEMQQLSLLIEQLRANGWID